MNQSCRSPPALCLPLQVTPVRRTAVVLAQSPRSTAPPAATSCTATAPQPLSRPKPSAPRPPPTERRSARSPVTLSSAGRRAKDSDSWSSAHWTVLRRPPPTVSPSRSILSQILQMSKNVLNVWRSQYFFKINLKIRLKKTRSSENVKSLSEDLEIQKYEKSLTQIWTCFFSRSDYNCLPYNFCHCCFYFFFLEVLNSKYSLKTNWRKHFDIEINIISR